MSIELDNLTQEEMRLYLINYMINERPDRHSIRTPDDDKGQERLLRGLFNTRKPDNVTNEFLNVQDNYLQAVLAEKNITSIDDLTPVPFDSRLYIWKGDITTLAVDAIVNAANSQMIGCFVPCHGCIDNAIHTYAGVQLRFECHSIMKKQGSPEETGKAKITEGYNLPCKYVMHTVGPIVGGPLTEMDCKLLAESYRSCLELAEEYKLESVAFCCISTGEFHFPNEKAAEIAVETVKAYLNDSKHIKKVVFNVFKDKDLEIYRKLLGTAR